ncbi:MAG: PaaI family thioesterase [Beijerinckiaceae bacterium]
MTNKFVPKDPAFATRVTESFNRQAMMHTIGAVLEKVGPGQILIRMPCAKHIGQQHGFVHGGAVATIADSACGYAALSLMPPGVGVLTAEFKINFLAPSEGDYLMATGQVEKPGRNLMVCTGRVESEKQGTRRTVAIITATMMVVANNDSVQN